MEVIIFKHRFSWAFFLMLFCMICFTAGQFVPIYFVDMGYRNWFYNALLLILFGSMAFSLSCYIKGQGKRNYYWSLPGCILFTTVTVLVFGMLRVGLLLGVWSSGSTIYQKKDNPEITIISRYWNMGGFGGGTSIDDYFIVLHRPVTPLFKIETSIDTNKLDKVEWVRVIGRN